MDNLIFLFLCYFFRFWLYGSYLHEHCVIDLLNTVYKQTNFFLFCLLFVRYCAWVFCGYKSLLLCTHNGACLRYGTYRGRDICLHCNLFRSYLIYPTFGVFIYNCRKSNLTMITTYRFFVPIIWGLCTYLLYFTVCEINCIYLYDVCSNFIPPKWTWSY